MRTSRKDETGRGRQSCRTASVANSANRQNAYDTRVPVVSVICIPSGISSTGRIEFNAARSVRKRCGSFQFGAVVTTQIADSAGE